MSVDETPGNNAEIFAKWTCNAIELSNNLFILYLASNIDFERSTTASGSPPTKTQVPKESTGTTTPYTPSNGQKRFNPFMKDISNAESNAIGSVSNKKSSTPTNIVKNHHHEQNDYDNNHIVTEKNKQNIQQTSDENKNIINNDNNMSMKPDNQLETETTTTDVQQQMLEQNQQALSETALPDWVVVGESVLIRPYNTSGVISFIGATHFQV